jgi:hypothetical protein
VTDAATFFFKPFFNLRRLKYVKGGFEKGLPSKVMGDLGAAIQHDAQSRVPSTQSLEEIQSLTGPSPGQSASREKDSRASFRKGIVRILLGNPPPFIGDKPAVLRERRLAPVHSLGPHLEKHGRRIDAYGAYSGTQAAQAALKRHLPALGRIRVIVVGDLLGLAVGAEEHALLLAQLAVDAG